MASAVGTAAPDVNAAPGAAIPAAPAVVRGAATAWYAHADCSTHEMGPGHPECPERLAAIDDQMTASGMAMLLHHAEVPLADDAALLRAHGAAHLEALARREPERGYAQVDPDTLMNPFTLRAARRAAGAAVAATDAVVTGAVRNAFCCVRPPGHHAGRDFAMGFCFFNNVAVAARHARAAHGLARVAVIDFDVHHGNGTEDIFRDDPNVLMVSIFQHPFYPYSGDAAQGPNMVNVPLARGADGKQLREAVEMLWMPALEAFGPEMLFISAGFDAHREDDLGQLRFTENDYEWVTRQLVDFAERRCHGRIVSCLEGGYNLSALGRSVVAHVKALAA